MDDVSKQILNQAGIYFENDEQLNGLFIERNMLVNNIIYESFAENIDKLKKNLSSSTLTSLHKEAKDVQPLSRKAPHCLHRWCPAGCCV